MDLVRLIGLAAVLILVTVVPVMIAAKWARARRDGFFAALGAVVLATVAAQVALNLIAAPMLGLVVAFVAACAAYALVLGSTFVAAVGIAVVALLLQSLIVVGLVWLGLELPVASPVAISV